MLYREDAAEQAELIADAQARAGAGLAYLEQNLGDNTWLLGDDFSAADIMVGFTLAAADALGVLNEDYPLTRDYLARLQARPAFQTAASRE